MSEEIAGIVKIIAYVGVSNLDRVMGELNKLNFNGLSYHSRQAVYQMTSHQGPHHVPETGGRGCVEVIVNKDSIDLVIEAIRRGERQPYLASGVVDIQPVAEVRRLSDGQPYIL